MTTIPMVIKISHLSIVILLVGLANRKVNTMIFVFFIKKKMW